MNGTIKIGIWLIAFVSVFFAGASECSAAVSQADTIPVYFRTGSSTIDRWFLDNNVSMLCIDERITDEKAARIASVVIVSSSSPEGTMESNSAIMERRAQSLRNHLTTKYPHLAAISTIRIETIDQTLARFLRAVEADKGIPNRQQVLAILRDESQTSVMRINAVKQIPLVKTYVESQIYPYMRAASICIGREVPPPPPPNNDTIRIVERIITTDTLRIEVPSVDTLPAPLVDTVAIIPTPAEKVIVPIERPFVTKPLFALKTNLLFDAATILNIEFEVPIGKHWSIAGEWMFPWWLWEKKQNCFQVMSGNIEGRYWFGNRDMMPNGKPRSLMTGWFAGLYVGGGYYDLEQNRNGYQGEFFIAAGVSGGYAHTINKSGSLRMEYSLGIGYMQTKYRKYEATFGTDEQWHLYRRGSGTYTWVGPTRAKVSLVWMLNYKKRGEIK